MKIYTFLLNKPAFLKYSIFGKISFGVLSCWWFNIFSCYYAQAKCKNSTLDIQYTGPCDQNVTLIQNSTYNTILINATLNDNNRTTMATTTSSTTTTTTYDPIKQIFCEAVLAGNVKCTNELDPYCGTDGQWYLNKYVSL